MKFLSLAINATASASSRTNNFGVGTRSTASASSRADESNARERVPTPLASLLRIAFLFLLSGAVPTFAQTDFDLNRYADPSQRIPISLSGYSGEVQTVLKFDLEIAGFEIVSAEKADLTLSGSNNGQVEGRLTDRISKSTLLAKRYGGAAPRLQAHALADDVLLKVARRKGIAQMKIAFKVGRGAGAEIYFADYDGANAVAVTHDNSLVTAPCFVPGRRILYYSSMRSGYWDIYSHNLDSGERRVVMKFPGLNTSPALSADGKKMAMILSKDGTTELYVANADGTNEKRLTKSKDVKSSPCWSPDNRTICFSVGTGSPSLQLISSEGGEMRRLTTRGVGTVTEPDWSPDGKWIAFTSMARDFRVCVVPAAGGDAQILTNGEDTAWAPNSRTLIFSRQIGGRRVLSLLDVPTKTLKDVPQNLGNCSQPCWAK